MIVVDASAGVEYVTRSTAGERIAGIVLRERPAVVPAHFDAECYGALVRLHRRGLIGRDGVAATTEALLRFRALRIPPMRLLPTVGAWLGRTSGPDAFYAALALELDAPLLTCDRALARGVEGAVRVLFVDPAAQRY